MWYRYSDYIISLWWQVASFSSGSFCSLFLRTRTAIYPVSRGKEDSGSSGWLTQTKSHASGVKKRKRLTWLMTNCRVLCGTTTTKWSLQRRTASATPTNSTLKGSCSRWKGQGQTAREISRLFHRRYCRLYEKCHHRRLWQKTVTQTLWQKTVK